MPTLSGTEFATYTVNDTTLTATRAEYIIDRAINLIVGYDESISIPNMQGTAGSKSLTVSQKKKGVIEFVARAIYASFEKNASNKPSGSIGQVSYTNADLMSNPAILAAIKEAAYLLRERDWSKSII